MSDLDKNKEISEENNKKDKKVDLRSEFIKEFTKENLSGTEKNNFIDEVMNNDSISSSSFLENKIKEFQAKHDKFNSFDEKKINIFDLKRAIAKEYSRLENARVNYLDTTFSNFDLDEKQKKKIEKEIKKLKIYDLEKLTNSNLENSKFLEKKLKTKINLLEKFSLGDILTEDEIRKRLEKLSSEDKKNVELILDNLNNFRVKDSDIRDLFSTNFLNKKEKLHFVSKYIPYIDLQKAVDIGLFDRKKAEKQKEKILRNILKKDLSGNNLEQAIKSASLSDIKIKTSDFKDEEFLDIIATEVGFSNLEKEAKEEIDKIKEDIEKNGPQNLEELKKSLSSLGENINNISNLKEGNIIKIIKKTEDGKDFITYGFIDSISDTNKEISIRWIGDNATGKEIINLDSYSNTTKTSFIDFLSNFKDQSKKADFLTKTEVQKLIDSGEIEDSKLKIKENNPEFNKNELHNKLDEIDSEGKGIELKKGGFISTKDGIYEVTGIDWKNGEINLFSNGKKGPQPEKLTFEDFYEAFKKNKATRLKPINSIEEFLKENQEKSEKKDIWSDYVIKNGRIEINKVPEYSKEKNTEVEYLVSDKSDDIFKIEKIDGDKITFRYGERKNVNSLDEKEKKKFKFKKNKDGKYEGELIKLSKDTTTMSLAKFNKLINSKKEQFYPDWQTGKNKTIENPQNSKNPFYNSFATKFWDRLSITEIIMGGKMMVENIQEYMKKGNDIHAAKVALKFGKHLPEEVRAELLIKVERAEQESMDKEIESLGKVDSPVATKRILEWLLNKDTPEYKKEAGLIFIIKKYGHLNSKEIYKAGYAGKFLWYEAFGGKIGDKLFLEIKEQAKKDNKTFTEEHLMYVLLVKQCKGNGYNGIHRRTRLHKEYKASWPNGVEEELKTGYTDASDERTARAMVDGGIGEMTGGTYSNAVGWFKKAIERGGSLEEMSEGFFTLLYSGALYNIDQKTYLKIKGLWDAEQMPMIMVRFSSFKSDMELFNKTVLELSKRIGEKYSDRFPTIYKEAQELFDDAINGKGKEPDRIKRAQKFWQKYGTPLSRALNMADTGNTTYSKTDKIVFLEKENNPIFKEYFDKVRGRTTEGTFGKAFMEDAMGHVGVTGLNTNQLTKQYLKMDVGGSMKEGLAAANVWKSIKTDIESVSKMDISDIEKRKYLSQKLRDLFSGFISNHGGREDALKSYNNNTSNIGETLNNWGIHIFNDLGKYSPSDVLNGEKDEIKKIINRVIDNILSGGNIISSQDFFQSGLEPINNTKYKVDEIVEEAA